MKSLIPFILLSFATVQAQQLAPSAPTSDATTNEQLLERQRQAKEAAARRAAESQTAATEVQLNVDPSKANKPPSLLARSEIISFGGVATLVPKRAIIHKPQSLVSRTGAFAQGDRLQSWREFYAANRGWITTMEVTRAQAEGKEPFSEEAAKSLEKSSAIVVATFSGDPISVLPAPPKEEAAGASTPNSSTKK